MKDPMFKIDVVSPQKTKIADVLRSIAGVIESSTNPRVRLKLEVDLDTEKKVKKK